MQAWRAGHNPAAAKTAHGGWFGLLADLDLLDEDEAAVWRAHRELLVGFETDAVTKSYKLVTLQAMLQDGTLRTGSSITQLAWTSHRIVARDPRLVADTRSDTGMPDPVKADEASWRTFWRKWPIAAWAGELKGQPGRWFRIDGERFVPTFTVEERLAAEFDATVAELVDWRLARYLFNKQPTDASVMRLRVGQSNGRPLIWLDRDRYPRLPTSQTPFAADGNEYVGNFVKVALNVARLPESRLNALPDLLRRWFGPTAGHPGTEHQVELRHQSAGWELRPAREDALEQASGRR